jgi:osmotically-inducible protein OsmY
VIEDGTLVGIVSGSTPVQVLADMADQAALPTADDRRIRDQVLAELRRLPRPLEPASSVVVLGGIVHLCGLTSTAADQITLRTAAEATPGVQGVKDHTMPIGDARRLL